MHIKISPQREPIAVIGIGCRFPGEASNPQKFWDLLCQKKDAIIETPEDRWDVRRFYDSNPNHPGKMIVKRGGFLKEKWDEFDAEFFQISPREAKFLDPQQRLLLEIAWEAMENGGLVPDAIRGSKGGVFMGAFTTDWQTLQNSPFNRFHCDSYSGINGSKTILSARLSHFFDLKGPCLSVDTACSSSLVALHLACQSLWQQESVFALAGGVNAMLVPETTIAMSKGHFLNPQGQCRSFEANAKGYVRGEGGGIVILKLLSQAQKDGDPIYALIRGTGVNHDGYTQGGITQPNSASQRDLIQQVLAESGVSASEITYVEAHGTGTPAGDPVEAFALNEVLNQGRSQPCYLGSVKSNIGHLEASAGIAGFIKAALCLKNKKIPPNLHFEKANPEIPFEEYCLQVPTELIEFPKGTSTYFALVNSFGYGGTNANVLLEAYESPAIQQVPCSDPVIFPFSAKSQEGLTALAINYENFISKNPLDLAYTLSHKRVAFDHRMTIAAKSVEELQDKLRLINKGEIPKGCVKGKSIYKNPSLAFVFTGMGPQWWGMGRHLLETSKNFHRTIQECDEIINKIGHWSLLTELQRSESESCIEQPEISQVANYAIQVALTTMLKEYGIIPNYIIGHSIGEVAAAYASGALTLEEGLRVSYHRSQSQSKRQEMGTMLATGLSLGEAQTLLVDYPSVSIAAENSQNAVTLSGTKRDLQSIAEFLEKSDIFNRFLKVNIAYHSHQMEGLEEEFLKSVQFLKPKKSTIPYFSTTLGTEYNQPLTAEYWWKNIRQPVLFASTLKSIIEKECSLFLEIGPHPVLGAYIKDALHYLQKAGTTLATLNKSKNDTVAIQECVGGLFVNGYELDWNKIHPEKGNFITLPTYPWQKNSHWIESEQSLEHRLGSKLYPMLNRQMPHAITTWQIEVNRHYFPWMDDHKIEGNIIFPAAGYIEAGLEIFLAQHNSTQCCLEEITFHQPLILLPQQEPIMQISWDPENALFKIHSLSSPNEKKWHDHASGKHVNRISSFDSINIDSLKKGAFIESQAIYRTFEEKGLEYGPAFQTIKRLWKNGSEALAEIEINHNEGYVLPPTTLDGAFQTLIGTFEQSSDQGMILPHQIEQLFIQRPLKEAAYCYARNTKQTRHLLKGDLVICDQFGNVCVFVKGLQCRILSKSTDVETKDLFYRPIWVNKPLEAAKTPPGFWLVGLDNKALTKKLAECLLEQKHSTEVFSLASLDEKLLSPYKQEDHLNIVIGYLDAVSLSDLMAHEIDCVAHCVELVKSIDSLRAHQSTHLWIITKNTQKNSLYGASLWGLGRVIRQEMPHLRCSLLDIENENVEHLVHELLYSTDEEIAFRQSTRYAFKLEKIQSENFSKNMPLSWPSNAFCLDLKKPGRIDSLHYKEVPMCAPLDQEVAIQVHAASLNFKDLMKVFGMLNQQALEGTYFGENFGMECTGTIVAIGRKVKRYKIGDQVCAFIPNSFQSYLTLSEHSIYPLPSHCTLDNGALYIPYITVLHALSEMGRLKKGESILIHSATGAVGLAAIQYAHYVGAHIYATASTEEKRAHLHTLGIRNGSDSRSLSFVDDILKWTQGKGVDVVLNSLGGDFLIKSFSLLAPHGRFLEIGKKDISINNKLPMRDFDRNTLFASIDMDRLFLEKPKTIQKLLKRTFNLFQQGHFTPLPSHQFPANEAPEAFKFMAHSKHIGKIMLKFAEQSVIGTPLAKQNIVDSNATYLITGGLSGFGLVVAKWLVEKGAQHLMLLGRSGASSEEAEEMMQQFHKQKIDSRLLAVDVSDYKALSQEFNLCSPSMPPLKGIIHSAMVLHDALLAQQTHESIAHVMRPKVGGCLNLHRLTSTLKLDFFVMFSSISSLIGNPGQGNYAAANSFLDSFCSFRRSLGLPATTINWGALKTGILSRNEKVAEYLSHRGIQAIRPEIALQVLEKAILEQSEHLCALDVEWKKLINSMPLSKNSFAFSDFRSMTEGSAVSAFSEQLSQLEKDQRLQLIKEKVIELIAKTLKMDVNKMDCSIRINKLGVDSLMAMELLAAIEIELGIKIPTMELMKGPTIDQLVTTLDVYFHHLMMP